MGIPIFLIFAQNIDCGYTLEPPRREKYKKFSAEDFQFLKPKSLFIARASFRNVNVQPTAQCMTNHGLFINEEALFEFIFLGYSIV